MAALETTGKNMWPFKSKKQPILRIIGEEFLGYETEPAMGPGGIGTEVDTFAVYVVTYEDVETGKRSVDKVLRLA